MSLIDKNDFVLNSAKAVEAIYDYLEALPVIELAGLEPSKTALVIMDMVNGFAREGALKSPRVEAIIPKIAGLSKRCGDLGIAKLAFADCHSPDSPEFDAYPPHCLAGTGESEIVTELKETGGYTLIPKNSTNGFVEEAFREWMKLNPSTDTFIITGDCTDICILQFAVTLKAWFNTNNRKSRVIVPASAVDTFDFGLHNGDLLHAMALYMMSGSGVEVAADIVTGV